MINNRIINISRILKTWVRQLKTFLSGNIDLLNAEHILPF